jgi:hypothetical protein
MAKKDFFLIVDTETTMADTVADFGAVVTNRKGEALHDCGVLLHDIFGVTPLFYKRGKDPENLWSAQGKDRRFDRYRTMLNEGTRQIASVSAVNRWLEKVAEKYNPMLTAYNLPFDLGKCANTGIDLNMFPKRFCLWQAAYQRWAHTKEYRQFVLDVHGFNPPTDKGNMSYKTNAEIMARFVLGNSALPDEPHTALEDIIGYELPILRQVIKKRSKADLLDSSAKKHNWRDVQVREHFTVK